MSTPNYDRSSDVMGVDPVTGLTLAPETTVSPGAGIVPSGLTGAANAGPASPCSVLGTGMNPDLIVYSAEAV